MQPLSSIGLGIVFAAGCDAHALGAPRAEALGKPGSDGYLSWLAGWDEEEQTSLGSPLSHSPEKVSAFD
jgi:hypothetical protein